MKIILDLAIIIVSLVNMFAVIKDRKSDYESKHWNVIILITSIILSCCWFTNGMAFKAGPEAVSYIIATLQAFMACMQIEFLRYTAHIKEKFSEIPNTDEYIDIGKWEEEKETKFIEIK